MNPAPGFKKRPDWRIVTKPAGARVQVKLNGQVIADSQGTNGPAAAKGTHVSLSRFDLHNTLIAAGPDFREGFINQTPSGKRIISA